MLPANRHLLPIIGIDIHMVLIVGAPVPMPHPFIGLVFDPFDWIPKIGATVRVNGMPRGNASTDGMLGCFVHIPMGGPFVMAPMIGHDSKNFFGSPRVKAEGSYFSGAGFLLMSCNDVGIPLSITPGKKFKPIPSLYLPTSAAIPIPAGKPVVVGGPYVPDLMSMLLNLAMSFGFGALLKAGGKAMKKALKALNQKVLKKFKCTQSLSKKFCKHGFEPVNLINGSVLYDGVDFELPGPIPLKWERTWYSDSDYEGLMGHGTHCSYDLTLLVMEQDNGIGITLPDGRATGFPLLAGEGELFYNRAERLTLTCKDHNHYELFDHNSRLTWQFVKRYDNVYKPVALVNRAGLSIQFFYNRKHVLEKIIDSCGRQVLLSLDGLGRIIKAEAQHRGIRRTLIEYGYNEAGDLNAITDANGKTTQIRYANHLMVEKTDRNGQTFYWEYDGPATGARCVHTWGDGGLLEGTIDYREGYNVVTNSLGEKKLYYYDENDLCIQETDALGNSVFHEYTDAPELYRDIDEEGNITGYVYDDRGNLITLQKPDGATRSWLYDETDQLQMVTDAMSNASVYVYKDNLLKSVVAPDRAVTSYDYNEQGLVISIQNEKGQRTSLQYDEDHNLISLALPGGAVSRWEYDVWGRCITSVNPEGEAQSYGYDTKDRVVRVRQYDGNKVHFRYNAYEEVVYAEDAHHKVHFEYTPMGNLSARQENGVTVRFNYNTEERLVSLINERHEIYRFKHDGRGNVVCETGFDGLVREYGRDNAGKVIRVHRPGKKYSLYEYDLAGRVTRIEHSDGTWEVYSYDPNGRLMEAVNENSTVSFQRDGAGRLISEAQDDYVVQSRYDKLGRRIAINSNLGATVKVGHNEAGYVNHLQAGNKEGVEWEARLSHNALGLETERLLPGGVISTYQYDRAGRPVGQAVSNSLRRLRHRIYSWNVNDRLQSMMNGLTKGIVQFGYDEFANLAWAKYEDNKFDFRTPDKAGNLYRTKSQDDRKYGAGGRLLEAGGAKYEYDEEGNLVSKRGADGRRWNYEWQDNGLLKKVIRPDGKEVGFEYDALGRRTAKVFDGQITRWVWNGNTPLHEWKYPVKDRPLAVVDEWGDVSRDKVEPVGNMVTWLFDEGTFKPAAKLTGTDLYSIITDYLGTPVEMYDGAGNTSWSVEYDIYGKIRKQHAGNAVDCPFRYQGQYEDEETGLYYNRFRYYDDETGRYTSSDPIGISGGFNTYAYVHDPNTWVDVLGLNPVLPIRATDLAGGPHAPGTPDNNLLSRAARSKTPQGRWSSTEAVHNAAAKYDVTKGGVQVVDIAPGDGKVFYNPVGSYPEVPGQKTYLILDADRAIIIPKSDGLHLFPIDENHPQYSSHYSGGCG
jgi:RHS repeat-associated protein